MDDLTIRENTPVTELNTDESSFLSEDELRLLENALAEAHEVEDSKTILPSNSPTLLIDETSSRFSSAEWFDEIRTQIVTLAGLGGIGSYVAFLLSRLKVNRLILWDDDKVDLSNLSGQLYGKPDIDCFKASAMSRFICNYSDYYSVICRNSRFDSDSSVSDIMMCGFDNMEARRVSFERWKYYVSIKPEEEKGNCLFIDGRLAAEEFQVFCIKGTDNYLMKKYSDDWLFSDNEAEQTLCSYKQTSFCANMIASVMVNLFVNFIANKCNPLIERELPFFTHYDAERMVLKTEIV